MNLSRLVFLVVAGCCFLCPRPAHAQAAAPYAPDKQYSADQTLTTKQGVNVTTKINADGGNIRSEMNMQGMQIISIMRSDQKKAYSIMPAQKMVMMTPLDPATLAQKMPTSTDDFKFENAGAEVVDGVPCIKYKATTTKDAKVYFWWVNTATKAPVKMSPDDGSFVLLWKNYKAGPQDAALFEVPKDYQVMQMPGAPGAGQ